MCLLVLKHLMQLYKNKEDTYLKLSSYYESLSNSENFSKEQIDYLFDGFDAKISAIKELVEVLKNLEKTNEKEVKDIKERNEVGVVKLVVKISLRNSLI